MRTAETWPNLVTMFFDQAEAKGERPFLWARRGGAWQSISWGEAAQRVAGGRVLDVLIADIGRQDN